MALDRVDSSTNLLSAIQFALDIVHLHWQHALKCLMITRMIFVARRRRMLWEQHVDQRAAVSQWCMAGNGVLLDLHPND